MSNLDTKHVINLDLIKDRANSVIKFGLADVETSDFYLGLYNNGSHIFDENYIVTLYIVKPNGTFRNIKLEPKEGLKKYYCNLPDNLKNIPGEYLCQAIIFDNLANEKKVSKSKFKYSVDLDLASEIAGIIGEEEQENILTNILNRLLTLENPVEPYATQKHVDECVSTLTKEIDTINAKNTEQDGRLNTVETKNNEQDNRLDIIEAKDIEQDNRLVNIESKNTEQDEKLNTIESKDIKQNERLNSLENKVDGIDEEIVDTIEPTLVNHGNRVDTLENKNLVHESRTTDIESKNVEQDNRLTSIEGINTTQNNRLDTLETKDITHESRMADIESKNTEQDNRLNSLESKDLVHESRITDIESKNIEQDERLNNVEAKDTEQDSRLDVAENRLANIGNDITNTMQPIIDVHTSRLDAIKAIDISQNLRLDAIETKNQQQDNRLLDIEKVNKKQDIDIKCLYGASQTIDVTKEGNSIHLQNSNNGFTIIDEIKGNTLVNCNKEPDKELILNGNINIGADNTVTLTEGVDGGLVDVALEGNTLVNVSKTKDSTAITKAYTVENSSNHIALQGEVDGSCTPVVTGKTLVNLCKLLDTTVNIAHLDNPTRITGTITIINAFKTNQVRVNRYNISDNTYVGTTLITSNVFKLDIPTGQYLDKIYDDTSTDFIPPSTLISDVLILEGDYTDKPIPDYFEGLQSTFEDNLVTQEMVDNGEEVADNLGKYKVEYRVTGKNKFDKSKTLDGHEIADAGSGRIGENVDWFVTDFIPVIPNISYKISGKDNGFTGLFYNKNKQLISNFTSGSSGVTIPNNVRYIRLNGLLTQKDTFQIEEGDTATSYEPYKEYTKTLYLNSPLLEGDTIEEKDGGIYHAHRYKKLVFDGNETLSIHNSDKLTHNGLKLFDLSQQNIESFDFHYYRKAKSNKFKCIQGDQNNIKEPFIAYITQDGHLWVSADINWTNQDMLNYINDCQFVYELPSPQYELIEQPNLVIPSYVNGHLDFNTAVPVEKVEFKPFSEELTYLYANTQYIVQFVSDKATTADITLGGTSLLAQSIVAGLNRISITTPETLVDNKLIISGVGANISEVVVTDTNRDFGYFEGMKSVGECEDLEVISSNSDGTLSNTQILTHEPLRAVGDVKDKYVLIDGKWYIERNTYKYKITGNEKINIYNKNSEDIKITQYYINGLPNMIVNSSNVNGISDKFPFTNIINRFKEESHNSLWCSDGNIALMYLKSANLTTSDVQNLLKDTTVIYQLKTPQYEPIDYNPLEVYSDITHITTNSTIPTNITVKNHGFNCLLKPSTTYTISSSLGLNTVTTPSTLTEDCLRFMDTDTSTVTTMKDVMILEGDYTTGKPLPGHFSGIESAFEQEYDEVVGKYKVKIRVQNEDASKENYIEFYIDEPLRGIGDVKDKVYVKNDKVVVERNCGIRVYEDGDFGTYITDKIDTVYQLAEPTYEEVEYNDTKLFIESFKNSTLSYNSNVPVTSKVYYSYSVPLVDKVAQTASISDQQDSMIIDMATQVAVLEMMTL